jgi:hypothetical protein
MLLPLSTLVATMVMGDVPGMVNPGTPSGVPASYDCAVRIHAWEFGKETLPARGVSVPQENPLQDAQALLVRHATCSTRVRCSVGTRASRT